MIIWKRYWNGVITIGNALEEGLYQKLRELTYERVNEHCKGRKKVLNSRTNSQN